ncbi:MAG: hypothetical protein C3F12_10645 [Candidatus Methylomirabilota bacterium]|nr:glycosyltransferase family 39 protein [candidate division NC10 bacterium]PWB44840.1 MAG: hypothetical protein C3F12_10645 [candidate division NC10 bacterium]
MRRFHPPTMRAVADVVTAISAVFLLLALAERLPFYGIYSSPFGVIKVGSKLAVWVCAFVLMLLMEITLRRENGQLTRLLTRPTPLRLFLFAMLVYSANGRLIGAVDTIPARYLPFTILREFDFDFDEFDFLFSNRGVPAYLFLAHDHYLPFFPPFAGLLALPVYMFSVWSGVAPTSSLATDLEKLSASTIAAGSVVVLYMTLKRLTNEAAALLITTLYAFGTGTFSISAQALWQHGPSELFLAATLYCLVRGMEERRYSAYAGFFLAAAVICRYTNLLIALPLTIYILFHRRDQIVRFLLFALPLGVLLTLYNYLLFDSVVLVPYAMQVTDEAHWTPLFAGLAAKLVSPNRGLLIFSPVLLFSFIGIYLAWIQKGSELFRYLAIGVALNIAFYSRWPVWRDEWSFGPRYLTDIAPLLALFLVPSYSVLQPRRALRWTFVSLGALSIVIHAMGAFLPGGWNPDVGSKSRRVWSWSDGQLIYSLRTFIHKTTGKFAPHDYPKMAVSVNPPEVNRAAPVEITVSMYPGTDTDPLDCYLLIRSPEGEIRFLTQGSVSSVPTPFMPTLVLRQPRIESIRHRLGDAMPPGRYKILPLLFRAGSRFDLSSEAEGRVFEGQMMDISFLPTGAERRNSP